MKQGHESMTTNKVQEYKLARIALSRAIDMRKSPQEIDKARRAFREAKDALEKSGVNVNSVR
jgi:hypothetical protein